MLGRQTALMFSWITIQPLSNQALMDTKHNSNGIMQFHIMTTDKFVDTRILWEYFLHQNNSIHWGSVFQEVLIQALQIGLLNSLFCLLGAQKWGGRVD